MMNYLLLPSGLTAGSDSTWVPNCKLSERILFPREPSTVLRSIVLSVLSTWCKAAWIPWSELAESWLR